MAGVSEAGLLGGGAISIRCGVWFGSSLEAYDRSMSGDARLGLLVDEKERTGSRVASECSIGPMDPRNEVEEFYVVNGFEG